MAQGLLPAEQGPLPTLVHPCPVGGPPSAAGFGGCGAANPRHELLDPGPVSWHSLAEPPGCISFPSLSVHRPAPLLLLSLLQLPGGSPQPPQPQRLLLGPPALPGHPLLSWLPFAPPSRPDSSDFFLLVREHEVFDSCLCHYSSLNAVVVLCYCQITSY